MSYQLTNAHVLSDILTDIFSFHVRINEVKSRDEFANIIKSLDADEYSAFQFFDDPQLITIVCNHMNNDHGGLDSFLIFLEPKFGSEYVPRSIVFDENPATRRFALNVEHVLSTIIGANKRRFVVKK